MSKEQHTPITTSEAAAILGKDARTVQRWADGGRIPVFAKLPGSTGAYLFNRDDVLAMTLPRSDAA